MPGSTGDNAGLAALFSQLGLSALPLAIVGGMVIGNVLHAHLPARLTPGITAAKSTLLRLGIVLYGIRLTFQDIAAVGMAAMVLDVLMVSSTFLLSLWLGRRFLKLDEHDAILIGAGSAICGAAAVLATEPVVNARENKVAVAIATVVVFGTLGMFLYPVLHAVLPTLATDENGFGIFIGATVHEVAQVVAAGSTISDAAANTAVITKMFRVMLLAPFLLGLSFWLARRPAVGPVTRQVVIPWFAVAFIAVVGLHSLLALPATWQNGLVMLDNLLLAMAMGALGLTTRTSAIRAAGLRPLLLAALLFVWLVLGGGALSYLLLHHGH